VWTFPSTTAQILLAHICKAGYAMNYYYNTKDDDEEEPQNARKISKAHTDLGCVTILYQDDVGGLQIRTKQGNWIDTKPLSGSFVVNLGDCSQMWSNCRYRSSEHRVVYG
ncbi:hypothetical protein KI387_013578, partial [Taxus chinensis]